MKVSTTSLLNLPLDAVPVRTPGELFGMVAPEFPNWIRRNSAPIALGSEGPEDEYMLYTRHDGVLYRLDVGLRDSSTTPYSTGLSRWNNRVNQTRMSIPWELLDESYFALPESRDLAAVTLMHKLTELHGSTAIVRTWTSDRT